MAETYFGPEPYAALWNYQGGGVPVYGGATDPLASSSPQIQALIDQGLITRTQHQGNNETGAFDYTVDAFNPFDPRAQQMLPKSTVPNTSFNWMPVTGREANLIDSSLVYHDPNYGLLTPTFNDKANKGDWQDMIGPLVMAAVTMGAGALASGAAGAAGLSAAEAGAGAGAAGAGWAGNTLTSTPWYLTAGQEAARTIGGMTGNSTGGYAGVANYGIPNNLLTPIQKTTPAVQPVAPASFYDPTAYGNMGNMGGFGSTAAPGDGSQRVASAVAPDAYGNSYNSVTT